jgi:hypothetical protein
MSTNQLNDDRAVELDLLVRIARQDRRAFEDLFARYSGILYATALKFLKQDADAQDVVQDVFIQIWDKLTPEQRKQVLDSLDKDSKLQDKAGIALAGGAAALTALSATVYFAGFAFYTTMSSVIFSTAGIFGLTVPFAAYAGASTTVGVLSGPVGWTILGLSALGSLVMLGSANEAKTAAFVTQVHLIKVQALKNSGKLTSTLKDLAL